MKNSIAECKIQDRAMSRGMAMALHVLFHLFPEITVARDSK
jgi:hypothetical protein